MRTLFMVAAQVEGILAVYSSIRKDASIVQVIGLASFALVYALLAIAYRPSGKGE
jgi:cbb3-type cytochrome oxidase subunit 3